MTDAMNIAVSGIGAASLQLNAAASNIVNMDSSGPVPLTPPGQAVAQVSGAVYQPLAVSQNTTPGGGVRAALEASLPSYYLAYDPNAPFANLQGMVAMPNADLASEIAKLHDAADSFRANMATFQASSRMFKTLLNTVA
jgi:flagellar basal-body rod protein FlgC